jgi:ketosteroid isomerase-like protein
MTEAKTSPNVQTITKWYEATRTGDRAAMAALCTADVKWEITPGFPHSGTFVGFESIFASFFAPLLQDFDGWQSVPETLLDAGDDVIGLGYYQARAKVTRKNVTAAFAHVWTVKDGKVTRLRQYADTVQLARALTD